MDNLDRINKGNKKIFTEIEYSVIFQRGIAFMLPNGELKLLTLLTDILKDDLITQKIALKMNDDGY